MLTDLLPEAEDLLREKYNVLDIINLLYFADNPVALYERLSSVYKECYDPLDRIIIMHFDTDFYIEANNQLPGFIISNLQHILSHLNIANCFVLLVTNHQNIANELTVAQQLYSNDKIPLPYVVCQLQQCWINPMVISNVELNSSQITKKYSCLNGADRSHRTKFIQLLATNNLIDQGIVSFNQTKLLDNHPVNNIQVPPEIKNLKFLTTYPWTNVNDLWNSKKINSLINPTIPNPIELDKLPNDINSRYQFLKLQESFVYVVTETVFNYPHSYVSEKSYKGITSKRPFIIVGAPGCLKLLQDQGYQTFSDYWDESYDSLIDPADRMLAVYALVNNICQKSIEELKQLLISMQDILNYNFDNYLNSVDRQLKDLEKQCQLNLQRAY